MLGRLRDGVGRGPDAATRQHRQGLRGGRVVDVEVDRPVAPAQAAPPGAIRVPQYVVRAVRPRAQPHADQLALREPQPLEVLPDRRQVGVVEVGGDAGEEGVEARRGEAAAPSVAGRAQLGEGLQEHVQDVERPVQHLVRRGAGEQSEVVVPLPVDRLRRDPSEVVDRVGVGEAVPQDLVAVADVLGGGDVAEQHRLRDPVESVVAGGHDREQPIQPEVPAQLLGPRWRGWGVAQVAVAVEQARPHDAILRRRASASRPCRRARAAAWARPCGRPRRTRKVRADGSAGTSAVMLTTPPPSWAISSTKVT
ncbi:hypothetical protein TSOC111612_10180 [Tsukamurella ocularis]